MKKNLFLYLFIFALLINVFTYMYFSNKQKYEADRIENLQGRVKTLKDSLAAETVILDKANYFSFEKNDDAQQYFAGQDIEQLEIKVRDGLYAANAKPGGNPYTGYPAIGGKPFVINQYKLLNNRWVIVDFTNGIARGEAIIKYFIEDDGSVTFENAETLLHANTIN